MRPWANSMPSWMVVAPDTTYVSLNTEDAELNKIMPWAGTSYGPQAFLDNLGTMFRGRSWL